jgi:hypothetical protein
MKNSSERGWLEQPDTLFLTRHGCTAHTKEIGVRENAPEDLRFASLDVVHDTANEYIGGYPETDLRLVVLKRLIKRVHEEKDLIFGLVATVVTLNRKYC